MFIFLHGHMRTFSLFSIAVVSLVFLLPSNALHAQSASSDRPNIIFVMADDLGYADLGSYGQEQIDTPNLDRMASQGMRFTDHYSGHTVCRPSRLVLRTGLHSGHTPIHGNADYVLPPEARITAKLLKQAGYVVGGVGKWALNGRNAQDPNASGAPTKQGFDMWFGYLNQIAAHNYWPEFLWKNDTKVKLKNKVDYADSGYAKGLAGTATKKVDYSHDLMMDQAFQFIQNNRNQPFFLQMHLTIPHANNQGKPHGMEVPDVGKYKRKDWPEPEKGFAGMIRRLDRDMGRLFQLLQKLNLDRETIVFFTSDNGPHSEGGHKHTFFDSNGPLRGYKRDLYEGGIRVPMIVRWPGKIEPGTVTDHASAFWDVMPTLCELAGVQPPEDIDGISFLPELLGRSEKQQTHDYLYWAFKGKRALRKGPWKLVRPGGNKPVELYNLNKDIGEQNDRSGKRPELTKKLKKWMKRAHDPSELPKMK